MSTTDTVYIENIPLDVTENELCEYFGRIGIIRIDKKTRRPKIWIYKDHNTGLPKGDATVTYEDPYAAASAVQWFHQKALKGNLIHVSLAKSAQESAMLAQTMDPAKEPVSQNLAGFPFTPSEDHRGQWHKRIEPGRGRGRKIVAAPQGPKRLFGPDDWPCPSCGNTNWARRPRCNLCGAPKPGTSDMKREGQAGGFKEFDQEEIAEARRRRKALEEADDGELYDDYGRIKKKYRSIVDKTTREEAALARLRGDYDPSPSGQELASLFGRKESSPVPEEKNPTPSPPAEKKPARERSRSRSSEHRAKRRSRRRESPLRSRYGKERLHTTR